MTEDVTVAVATPWQLHNAQFCSQWTASRPTKINVHIGGTARDYQRVFAALTAQQSGLWPNETVSPAVYLYIAALGANDLNCRISIEV